jgi:hypothetical protein
MFHSFIFHTFINDVKRILSLWCGNIYPIISQKFKECILRHIKSRENVCLTHIYKKLKLYSNINDKCMKDKRMKHHFES